MLNYTPTSIMTILRPTIKVKKWAVTQFLEIPTLFPKIIEIVFPLTGL